MGNFVRALGLAVTAVLMGAGSQLVLGWNPWMALTLAVGVLVGTPAIWAVLNAITHSQRAFASQYGWEADYSAPELAAHVMGDRTYDGALRNTLSGWWRGRVATQFQARVHRDTIYQDEWIDAVFDDFSFPTVTFAPRLRWRRSQRDLGDPESIRDFGRSWKVYSDDEAFAHALTHRGFRDRLLADDARGNRITLSRKAAYIERVPFIPSAKGSPERLDLLSDLLDLIPREALQMVDDTYAPSVAHRRRPDGTVMTDDGDPGARLARAPRAPTAAARITILAARKRKQTLLVAVSLVVVLVIATVIFVTVRSL